MAEINYTGWTSMNTCVHMERSMKIKRRRLDHDSCAYDNMKKSRHFDEDLTPTT